MPIKTIRSIPVQAEAENAIHGATVCQALPVNRVSSLDNETYRPNTCRLNDAS